MLEKIIVCLIAGAGAGLGTGFAGMSAAAVITPMLVTFLGFDPKLEITCMDGEMKIGNLRVNTDKPADYLRQILAEHRSPRLPIPGNREGL